MILNSLVPAILPGDLGVHGDRGQLGSGAVVQVGLGVPDPGRRAGRRGEARLLGRRGSGRRPRENAVLDVPARVLAGGADLDPAVGKRAGDRCANGHLADEDGARGRARAHIRGLERGAGHRGGGRGGRREADGGAPRDRAPEGERHGHNEAAGVGEDHAVLQDSGMPAREATEVVAGDGRRARQAARAPRIPATTESPTRRCAMPEGTDLRRPRGRRCRHSA